MFHKVSHKTHNDGPHIELASPIYERPINNSTEVSDFERSLFKDGAYFYDPEAEQMDAENDIARIAQWYGENPYWDEQRTKDSLDRDIFFARWELAWKQHFSGLVPKHWEIWYGAMDDVEEAGRRKIQLSTTLIDAAISHEHHLVAKAAGTLQKLNVHQMAIALARELPQWNINQVLEAQRSFGMTDDNMREAHDLAKEIRKHMTDGTIQLASGSSDVRDVEQQSPIIRGVLSEVIENG